MSIPVPSYFAGAILSITVSLVVLFASAYFLLERPYRRRYETYRKRYQKENHDGKTSPK